MKPVRVFKNNVGPQVRRLRYARGWSQSTLAAKLQIAGMETDRSGVSKIEARLIFVDDRTLMYLAEVLKVAVQDLLPKPNGTTRLHDFLAKLATTRF
jgi:HTH-type transcriptional regulator, cell division transcriptional repressor